MKKYDSIEVRDAVILYDERRTPPVLVVKQGDMAIAGDDYRGSMGAAYSYWREAPLPALCRHILREFHTLVVRERLPVEAVHDAFLNISQYRQIITRDTRGAEDESDELAYVLSKGA